MNELKEHVVISHQDIILIVRSKESIYNVVQESEDPKHKNSDNNADSETVEWTNEMKENLLREIEKLCNKSDSSESSVVDCEDVLILLVWRLVPLCSGLLREQAASIHYVQPVHFEI